MFAIALTDSAHSYLPDDVLKIIGHKTCDWVSSSKPLGTEIKSSKNGFKLVSAGMLK